MVMTPLAITLDLLASFVLVFYFIVGALVFGYAYYCGSHRVNPLTPIIEPIRRIFVHEKADNHEEQPNIKERF